METHEYKRLYRSETNKILAGVCGGLGEYLNTDPVVLRLLWLIVTILTGIAPGVVIYIIAIFIIPAEPARRSAAQEPVHERAPQ